MVIRSWSSARKRRTMAIYRRCVRCNELFEGCKCPNCSKKRKRIQAINETKRVYNSYTWQQCRANVRLKYMDYDIWLLGAGQAYVCKKPIIHHILEREERPDLLFDIDNLIPVCKESHEEIHQWYKTDREAALNRIEKGKAEFRRLFADD